jgi:hypothetical protein
MVLVIMIDYVLDQEGILLSDEIYYVFNWDASSKIY